MTKDLNVDSSDAQITGWANSDTLVINNGATVTVNSNQTKFWNIITINNGKCIYNGQKYESQFNVKDLVKDTKIQNFIKS